MYDWNIADYDTDFVLNGDDGTLRINACGYFVGGTKNRIFSTPDGLQLDAGDAQKVEIDELDLLFTPDDDADHDYVVNIDFIPKSDKAKIMNIVNDLAWEIL